MRSLLTIIFTSIFSCLLAACETILSAPETQSSVYSHPQLSDLKNLSCEDLNPIAEKAFGGKEAHFFVIQLANPGDWRTYSETTDVAYFVKNKSRRRLRQSDVDWSEIETLIFNKTSKAQETHRVRIPIEMCTNPPKNNVVQMVTANVQSEKGASAKTEEVDLAGKAPNDNLARIICGLQDYPEITSWEQAAQKWKRCQTDGRRRVRLILKKQ